MASCIAKNLQKKGFYLPSMCVLCMKGIDSQDHIFFECAFSSWVWKQVLIRFDLSRQSKNGLIQELQQLQSEFPKSGQLINFARILFRITLWRIWKERCRRIFEGTSTMKSNLLIDILHDARTVMEAQGKKRLTKREKSIFNRFNLIS